MSERKRREVLQTVQRELRARREEAQREAEAVPMGMERPSLEPVDGRRGAVYCGDLYEVIREAAYRPDVRAAYSYASNMTAMKGRSHLWTLYAGDPDPRKQTPAWEGSITNCTRGMVPEFTMMEHFGDPESEIHCLGWREVLHRCLSQKVIRPSAKVLALLGTLEYYRFTQGVRTAS
jgi:hypothetical protein